MLLKIGRHIRPAPHFKLIIAREEGENRFLSGYRRIYPSLETTSHGGPLALIDGDLSDADLELAGRIVARYSQGREAQKVELEHRERDGSTRTLSVVPLATEALPKAWIL
jgi:tRNA-uridine 2-sulfurtransferase